MLKYLLLTSLLIAAWVLLTACSHSGNSRFTAPAKRPAPIASRPWPPNSFLVIAYHDVEDDGADQRYMSVRTSALNDQMVWLKRNDYRPVSVQQILDARNGGAPLPPKAVLLTFDDGYSSFYTRVWPLLKAYNWPALWAPVGIWVSTPENKKVDFGGLPTAREKFATWDIVREVSRSPLVEIGSHTWASHYGGVANPQGSSQPAAANRIFNKKTGQYETDEEYQARIDKDVATITAKIEEVTGKAPRAWVWPYGAANGVSLSIIKQHGYQMAFTLEDGLGNVNHLDSIPRQLINGNPSLQNFAEGIISVREPNSMRVMHIDLDDVYDPNPAQQKKNIDKLIQRVYDMRASHVFLQAYADPTGDGTAREVYFKNRWLPVRSDLFNFVAWQLQTRAGAKVYASMPVLAFNLDKSLPRVQVWDPKTGAVKVDPTQYQRLSPFNAVARQRITEIYEDLARYANFAGVLFHDDALLTEFEDASPDAMTAYHQAGFKGSITDIRNNPQEFARWTRFKSRELIDFTKSLTETVHSIRGPQVRTARNIYATPVLDPQSESRYAQNLNDYLTTYDWTAPMAMPLREGVPLNESGAWLDSLVTAVNRHPDALRKTIFELQARNWRQAENQGRISGKQLAQWMDQLEISGASSLGYYPDDFINGQPGMDEIRPSFSAWWYPQKTAVLTGN
ncbi:poly-beta-1,6-N-acetyl-D-glucosamine N-deacetylase PgaB [Franconibacter pulveris]|uniref:poly-beta-1,6-N-acetyl-D-glucosamine N-deacetylase PgaB n=1 Tax=Franconibacter pulveris TaxID=435910 RepID=UPI000496B624|nr:poly-beta-1,6-N-acetyl-D-glucosamine N-deacetylase PgaB [Franconibacter pulveris]